ncbi:MAG: tRNA (5-methylaminomethyl-2-thiouridine)(34)-methyltransferase MnmD [Bacteroidetes bacterium]|nr:tRNA (5-methylaminomethyl-2-thiouridine)(34)-methyltransferase MnmD [Bacteroidota bacterium]
MESEKNNRIEITRDGSHTVWSARFGVSYHSVHGARTESNHVFIKHGLDYVFQQRQGPVRVFEMGFGTGFNAYLSYLHASRMQRMVSYTGIEKYPLEPTEISALNYPDADTETDRVAFRQLHDLEWNRLCLLNEWFEFRKVRSDLLELRVSGCFDLVYYDAFAPVTQPDLWACEAFEKVYELLDTGGILVTYCAQGQMKRNMAAVGFRVETLPGPPGKREMTRAHKI